MICAAYRNCYYILAMSQEEQEKGDYLEKIIVEGSYLRGRQKVTWNDEIEELPGTSLTKAYRSVFDRQG